MESGILNLEKISAKAENFASDFTDLKVFQLAFDISLIIHKRSLELPKIEQYSLADQLRRCTKSVCANLVEGYSKQQYSGAEFKRFIHGAGIMWGKPYVVALLQRVRIYHR